MGGTQMDSLARKYLDYIGHPIFALERGRDGLPRYCAFNKVARELLGKTEEEILGRTALELYPGRLGQLALARHVEVFRTGLETTYELSLPLKAGQRRILTTLRPELDDNAEVVRLFGNSADVSDRQALVEMRTNAATLSGELDKVMARSAVVTHEPMQKVKAIADMLRHGFMDLGDGKLELIDTLEKLATDAMALIADAHGHIETATERGNGADFQITAVVSEIMSLLDPLSRSVCRVSPTQIRGDRMAMFIVLRGLIDNSKRRYLALEQKSLVGPHALSISVSDAGTGMVGVTIEDNGAALDKPALSVLNDGALRGDADADLLDACRTLRARRGDIVAENVSEGGVRVSMTFPGDVQPVEKTGALCLRRGSEKKQTGQAQGNGGGDLP